MAGVTGGGGESPGEGGADARCARAGSEALAGGPAVAAVADAGVEGASAASPGGGVRGDVAGGLGSPGGGGAAALAPGCGSRAGDVAAGEAGSAVTETRSRTPSTASASKVMTEIKHNLYFVVITL